MTEAEPVESRFEIIDDGDTSGRRVVAQGDHSRGNRRVEFTFRIDPTGETTMLEIEQTYLLDGEVVQEEGDSLAVENGTVPHIDQTPTSFAESAFNHNPELLLGRLFDQALADDDSHGPPGE